MPAYKDSKTGTWFVKFYCKDWTGENKQIKKRGFDMIILKSFIFYSDEIKKDEKLINAYEDILLALTEIRNEKAAVLLDEFRIH